jgi:hypothetical protein
MTPEERSREAIGFIDYMGVLDHLTATRLKLNVIAAIRAAEYDALTRAEDEFEGEGLDWHLGHHVVGRIFDLKSKNLGMATEPRLGDP